MYSIGELSKITGLSVKTIRFYHEKELLPPSYVDDVTGYRYYSRSALERARVVICLRDMEFSLDEIAEILESCSDEADILDHLERQRQAIAARIKCHKHALASIEGIIANEREMEVMMKKSGFDVEEKVLETQLIAGVRMKGKYSDCGQGFAKIGKSMGRFICGKPLNLFYDAEYREDDADFEPCMPVRKGKDVEGISVRELTGGRCIALIHKGPWDSVGRSYEKILNYLKEKGYNGKMPSREVYIKGPGMIFKGNPKNYLTEIQILIESSGSGPAA